MTSNGRTRRFARALIVALSLATLGFLAPVVAAAPAQALTNVGTTAGVEARCNNSPYYLCLYYNSTMATAWWGTSVDVPDLTGYRFFANTGEGSGQAVEDNAAAVSCDASSTSICYIFVNPGYTGARDYLHGQRRGRLVEAYNRNSSVDISFGA